MGVDVIDITYLETHFPLSSALLCVDCDMVFQNKLGVCPSCGGASVMALSKVLGSVTA